MGKESRESSTVFRLAAGVELVPVAKLPAEIQDRLEADWGRFALIRSGARAMPLLIDEESAALVEEFRQPGTIRAILVRLAQRRNRDPDEVLRRSFSLLQRLLAQRFLVDVDNAEVNDGGRSPLAPGDRLEDFEIVRPLQRLEDMEVFQVRLANGRFGALKITVVGTPTATDRLSHEAAILRFLDGDSTPELLRAGKRDGRQFLLLEWGAGSDALVVCEEWRHRAESIARQRLLEICCGLLATYGNLHHRGVIHGDVNPRNVIIDARDRVMLLDFEDAVRAEPGLEQESPRDRAGVSIYFEPEYARALLAGKPEPPASQVGEQYALAALVYELLAGVPYLDFDLRWNVLLKQIVEDPPATFAERGLPSWPSVEDVLLRALSKEPEQRFPSVATMAAALAQAQPAQSPRQKKSPSRDAQLDELIQLTTAKTAVDGPWMTNSENRSPPASVYDGAAGVALALYRMSRDLEDEALLALADSWIQRASTTVDEEGAEKDAIGASPFVGSVGVHLVDAKIAAALGQRDRQNGAIERSLRCLEDEVRGMDLHDGRAGRLLALCCLLVRCEVAKAGDRQALVELGGTVLGSLWARLQEWPPIADAVGDLGMAHGWAGFLYATLRWCQRADSSPPSALEPRLLELADQRVPIGRGLMWPWRLPLSDNREPRFTAGWCNGSAGYVFLWTTAARVFSDDSFLVLAEGAAWNCWESAQRDGSLCCGLVGRAYALLDVCVATGDKTWLDRARDLTDTAVREGEFGGRFPEGLFQGELGLALLAADLRRPERAWFPWLTAEPVLD